jgi:hypothetical protein
LRTEVVGVHRARFFVLPPVWSVAHRLLVPCDVESNSKPCDSERAAFGRSVGMVVMSLLIARSSGGRPNSMRRTPRFVALLALLVTSTCGPSGPLQVSPERLLAPSESVPSGDGFARLAFGAGEYMVFGTTELARIRPDGVVLDPDGQSHPPPKPGGFGAPKIQRLASDGQSFFSLSTDNGTIGSVSRPIPPIPSVITLSQYGSSGEFVGALDIDQPGPIGLGADLACGPNHCLAVWWRDGAALFGGVGVSSARALFMRTSGGVQLAPPLELPETTTGSHVVFDGTQYVLAFSTVDYGLRGLKWYTVRVSSSGVLLDGTPRFARSLTNFFQGASSFASNGQGSLLLTPESGTVANLLSGQLLDASGAPRGAPFIIEGDGANVITTAAASDGVNYLIAWKTCSEYDACVPHTAVVNGLTGALSAVRSYPTPEPVRSSNPLQLAFDGTNYMATWDEGPWGQVIARRISPSGAVLDRREVIPNSYVPFEAESAVGWNGCSYLASYVQSDNREGLMPVGTLLDAQGNSRQPLPFLMPDLGNYRGAVTKQRLVRASTGFLLAFDLLQESLSVQRVNASGVVLEPSMSLDGDLTRGLSEYAVSSNGQTWMTVRSLMDRTGSADPNLTDVYAQQIPTEGAPGPTINLSNTAGDVREHHVALASHGEGYLAVWGSFEEPGVRGVALGATGQPSPTRFEITTQGIDVAPQVIWTGADYLVLWDDAGSIHARRYDTRARPLAAASMLEANATLERIVDNGRELVLFYKQGSAYNVLAKRFTRAGVAMDSTATALNIGAIEDAASDGTGRILVTSQRSDGRIVQRIVTSPSASPPATCTP